jgi:E3 ubiquitin-protein ligase SHPRH
MGKVRDTAAKQAFAQIPEFKSLPQKGIESHRIAEALERLCGFFDVQANQLDAWREHVIQLLLKPLLDENDDDITGEEFDESTKLQEEIMVYVQVLRAMISDRQRTLSGQENALVDHEYRVAVRQAMNGEGPFPAKMLELFRIRDGMKFKDRNLHVSLRGIVSELRGLSLRLRHEAASGSERAQKELEIVMDQLKLTQCQLTEQNKVSTAMEHELERFTSTMNARVDFYRQLQAVSDSVADYKGSKTEADLATTLIQEGNLRQKLAAAEAKHRYRKSTTYFLPFQNRVNVMFSSSPKECRSWS